MILKSAQRGICHCGVIIELRKVSERVILDISDFFPSSCHCPASLDQLLERTQPFAPVPSCGRSQSRTELMVSTGSEELLAQQWSSGIRRALSLAESGTWLMTRFQRLIGFKIKETAR